MSAFFGTFRGWMPPSRNQQRACCMTLAGATVAYGTYVAGKYAYYKYFARTDGDEDQKPARRDPPATRLAAPRRLSSAVGGDPITIAGSEVRNESLPSRFSAARPRDRRAAKLLGHACTPWLGTRGVQATTEPCVQLPPGPPDKDNLLTKAELATPVAFPKGPLPAAAVAAPGQDGLVEGAEFNLRTAPPERPHTSTHHLQASQHPAWDNSVAPAASQFAVAERVATHALPTGTARPVNEGPQASILPVHRQLPAPPDHAAQPLPSHASEVPTAQLPSAQVSITPAWMDTGPRLPTPAPSTGLHNRDARFAMLAAGMRKATGMPEGPEAPPAPPADAGARFSMLAAGMRQATAAPGNRQARLRKLPEAPEAAVQRVRFIGRGSNGLVSEIRLCPNRCPGFPWQGRAWVAKEAAPNDRAAERDLKKEVELCAQLPPSRHVLRTEAVVRDPQGGIRYALAALGECTLQDWIRQLRARLPAPPPGEFPPPPAVPDLFHGLAQIARGLQTLHSAGWVHGDMHEENVLVTCGSDGPRPLLALIDFGAAERVGHPNSRRRTDPSPELWRAMDRGKLFDVPMEPAHDAWSLGLLLLNLVLWEDPFDSATWVQRKARVRQFAQEPEEREAFVQGLQMDPRVAQVALGLLADDPERRWDMAAVLKHCNQ